MLLVPTLGQSSKTRSDVAASVSRKQVDAVIRVCGALTTSKYRTSPDGLPTYDGAPALEPVTVASHGSRV